MCGGRGTAAIAVRCLASGLAQPTGDNMVPFPAGGTADLLARARRKR